MAIPLNEQLRLEVLEDFAMLITEVRGDKGEWWMDSRVDGDKKRATRRWVLATAYKVLKEQPDANSE